MIVTMLQARCKTNYNFSMKQLGILNKKYYILQQLSNDYDKLIYDIEENAGKYIECYINNVCFNLAQNEKNDLRDEIKEEVHNRLMEYKKQINN